jgi:hypothetical protein
MRLSFKQCCHAFVAFSQPNFRVKAARQSAFGSGGIASPKEMLRDI